jgi:molecular chaperone DnaK
MALQRIRDGSERAKIALSRSRETTISLPKICIGRDGRPHDLIQTLNSDQFRNMCMDLVQRTFKVCDEAFQSGRLSTGDVEGIILVGGPTRLPLIRDSVQHYFRMKPLDGINPDEVVAIGAAIFGSTLTGRNKEAYLLDVTPLSLKVATVGGYTETLIPKNTAIPTEKSKVFTTSRDWQDRVRIRVHQGEHNRAESNVLLGEFEFSGFKIAQRGEVNIRVTFELDSDGIVNVSATDVETGRMQSTTIYMSSGLSEEEVALSAELSNELSLERNRDLPAAR